MSSAKRAGGLVSTQEEIVENLNRYMRGFPETTNSEWYVGIATNPRNRLFDDHNVSENTGIWSFATADTHEIARAVEQSYLDAGCDGGGGGGDSSTKAVYVYLKTSSTNP